MKNDMSVNDLMTAIEQAHDHTRRTTPRPELTAAQEHLSKLRKTLRELAENMTLES